MKNLHSLALVISLAAASVLSAQTAPTADGPRGAGGPGGKGPGQKGPGGRHHFNPVVRAIDADKDGVLSAAELANASAAILTLDADKNGSVSATELRPARPTPPADAPARPERPANAAKADSTRPRPVDPVMLALDADKDGALSATEIVGAANSLTKGLDANADGKLTQDELRPLPPVRG